MRLLLDTHTLLWWVLNDRRLSRRARNGIEAPENVVFVSAASAWEIAIKAAKGKLVLPQDGEREIRQVASAAGFRELAVTWDHGLAVRDVIGPHADPFDRLLIAQSRLERLTIVTNDRVILRYPVDVLW